MNEDMLVLAETLMRAEVEAGIKRAISQLPKQPPDFDGCCVSCGRRSPQLVSTSEQSHAYHAKPSSNGA